MAERRLLIDVEVEIADAKRRLDALDRKLDETGGSAQELGRQTTGAVATFKGFIGAAAALSSVQLALDGVRAAYRLVKNVTLDAIDASQNFTNTFLGLTTIATKFGIAAGDVTDAAKALSQDGLLGVSEAAAGLKNLLSSGFGLPEAISLMEGFKDSASFNRQASLDFGAAVVSATEGIKNQNSILVDNAGLTKNLSVIMKEAGLSVSDLASVSSDATIRGKFLAGLLKELGIFAGDAAKLTNTYSGATSRLGTVWREQILPTLGMAITENENVIRVVREAADALVEFAGSIDVEKVKGYVSDGLEILVAVMRGLKVTIELLLPVFDAINTSLQINQAIAEKTVEVWQTATSAIVGLAQDIHDGVRNWLVDRFNAIVESVRSKVEAVSDFFRDLKDKVVGNSHVPDMVDLIEVEFARLQTVMVEPTRLAATQIDGIFAGLVNTVPQRFRGLMDQIMGGGGGGEGGEGFFSTVFGGSIGGLNDIFQRAFEGGGGLGGAIQSFATSALAKGLNFVPIIGPILSQFAGAFVSGFKRLFGGIGGFFKNIFGGPDEAELAGRDTANAWIDSVIATTNISSDRIEKAVNEGWDPRLAEFALSAQDVWTAAGSTAEAAMAWTQRFFDAIKEGPGAVQPLIDEFMRMQNSAEGVSDAVDEIFRPRTLDYKITGDNSQFINVVNGTVGRDATSVNIRSGGQGQFFANGGMVQAFPFGGLANHVPALVEPGEFVIRKAAVNKIGAANLARMNAGGGTGTTVNVTVNGGFLDSPNTRRKLAETIAGEFRKTLASTGRVGF